MKKTLVIVLILALLASFALLAGCGEDEKANVETAGNEEAVENTDTGGEKAEITDEEGKKITVEESQEEGESDKVVIEGENGEQSTIEVQEQAPSEEALGAPIYPGSQYIEGTGINGTAQQNGQEVSIVGAEFATKDAITKVVEWYKGKLSQPPMSSTPENTTWILQTEDGAIISIVVELYEDTVKITINKLSGDIGDITP